MSGAHLPAAAVLNRSSQALDAMFAGLGPQEGMSLVEQDFPDWHLFISRDGGEPTGTVYAVTTYSALGGSGTTLAAAGAMAMWREIARTYQWWEAHGVAA